MTTTTDGTPTPEKVIELATKNAKLERTALIGVFGTEGAFQALIRLPKGDIAKVSVGDSVAGGKIEAIAADRVILSRLGGQKVLSLPQG